MIDLQALLPEERDFLSHIAARHPAIAANFKRYLSFSSSLRPTMAQNDLGSCLRAGWVRRGIRNPESVKLHVAHVVHYAFEEAPENVDARHSRALALVHDIPEAIITDFTPADPITPEEKAMLEIMAIKVIYQDSPYQGRFISLIREYEAQQTAEAQWVNDVDKLDPVFVALHYEAMQPEKMGLFEEFSLSAGKRLKTDKGRTLLIDAISNQESYRAISTRRADGVWMQRGGWPGR